MQWKTEFSKNNLISLIFISKITVPFQVIFQDGSKFFPQTILLLTNSVHLRGKSKTRSRQKITRKCENYHGQNLLTFFCFVKCIKNVYGWIQNVSFFLSFPIETRNGEHLLSTHR